MLKRRVKSTSCNCNGCNKKMDGQFINVIELYTKNIMLCDDCLDGLHKLTGIKDQRIHQYVSENKQVY